MKQLNITITGDFIELFQLLKLARLTETGGQAKECIRNGEVILNDAVATELRKKIRASDRVCYLENEITVTPNHG